MVFRTFRIYRLSTTLLAEGLDETYELHRCHLTRSRQMGSFNIGIENFDNNLSTIIHRQKQDFIVHAQDIFQC